MPGTPALSWTAPGASAGYAVPSGGQPEGYSHSSFIVWLLVYTLLAVAIVGGLKVGGFSFVFRTR